MEILTIPCTVWALAIVLLAPFLVFPLPLVLPPIDMLIRPPVKTKDEPSLGFRILCEALVSPILCFAYPTCLGFLWLSTLSSRLRGAAGPHLSHPPPYPITVAWKLSPDSKLEQLWGSSVCFPAFWNHLLVLPVAQFLKTVFHTVWFFIQFGSLD